MPEIVKVQVPLFTNSPKMQSGGSGLVYDVGRKHFAEQPLPPAVFEALGKDVKGFFLADWNNDSETWEIGERTTSQGW